MEGRASFWGIVTPNLNSKLVSGFVLDPFIGQPKNGSPANVQSCKHHALAVQPWMWEGDKVHID